MSIINKLHYNLLSHRSEFLSALPFPHLVLDNFIDAQFFNKLSSFLFEIDEHTKGNGKRFNSSVEQGKWISLNASLPSLLNEIIYELNSDAWVLNLRQLTGFESLFPTKVGNTKLANYHEMKQGGFLGPHLDHAADPDTGLPHVLNQLIYLSTDWREDFGGGTLFFDSVGRKIIRRIDYKPNRCVIFLHTPYCFHGVDKISQRAEFTRKSLYVDYYSTSRIPYCHMNLPFPNHWFYHQTTFLQDSFFQYLDPRNFRYLKSLVVYKYHKSLSLFTSST